MNKAVSTVDNFIKLKKYVCKEEIFKEMIESGFTMNDAYVYTNGICYSQNKRARILELRKNNVSEELIYCYDLFSQVFSELSCVSSATEDIQFANYKLNYFEEYENISNCNISVYDI